MSQNILIISTSPRKDGNSDTLCGEVMRGAADGGAICEKVRTAELDISPCIACERCHAKAEWGECVIKDDFIPLLEKMQRADTVVFATPVYFYDVSAQLKLVFDRSYCTYTHPLFKHAAFVTTKTGAEEGKFRHILESFELYVHCLKTVDIAGTLAVAGLGEESGGVQIDAKYLAMAYDMGRSLAAL